MTVGDFPFELLFMVSGFDYPVCTIAVSQVFKAQEFDTVLLCYPLASAHLKLCISMYPTRA
jgi:hypothetical protein